MALYMLAGEAMPQDTVERASQSPSDRPALGRLVLSGNRIDWPPSRRTTVMAAVLFGLCAIIAVDIWVVVGSGDDSDDEASALRAEDGDGSEVVAPAVGSAASQRTTVLSEDEYLPSEAAAKEPKKHHAVARARARHLTVSQAAARTCSTSSVKGLSMQIIEQSRCIDPRAFTRVPSRPNLETQGHVFLYLTASARDHLLKALDANKNKTLQVHSALRTVAQQYLLSQWDKGNRCGIKIAANPGESNHETGLALDVAGAQSWRKALEKEGFHWMGAVDRVHFDYKGAPPHNEVDVKAFQQLWNRNHSDDRIEVNGHYTPTTEKRLKASPAEGFPKGPHCG